MKKSTVRPLILIFTIIMVIVFFPAILESISAGFIAVLNGLAAVMIAALMVGIIVTICECVFDIKLSKPEAAVPAGAAKPAWNF